MTRSDSNQESLEPVATSLPPPNTCSIWIPTKRRFCSLPPLASGVCQQHLIADPDVPRKPCKWSCGVLTRERNYERHSSVCNARPIPNPGYYVEDINRSQDEKVPRPVLSKAVDGMTPESV